MKKSKIMIKVEGLSPGPTKTCWRSIKVGQQSGNNKSETRSVAILHTNNYKFINPKKKQQSETRIIRPNPSMINKDV